jgi:serine/threonine protein kinase
MQKSASGSEFLRLVRESKLVSDDRIEGFEANSSRMPAEAIAEDMVQRKLLSRFQATQILKGGSKGFWLDQYKIIEPLGTNEFGHFLRVQHGQSGQSANAVFPIDDWKLRKDLVAKFLKKAKACIELQHPNLADLLDAGLSGSKVSHPFAIFEDTPVETLTSLATPGEPMNFADVLRFCTPVAAALAHVHQRGFVHGRVSPNNIRITRDGSAKLFGIGVSAPEGASNNSPPHMQITPLHWSNFLSPEQLIGAAFDHRADIYSLGATLFTMISAAPPFNGTIKQKTIQIRERGTPTLDGDSSVPSGLSKVIAKMMAVDPGDRHASIEEAMLAMKKWVPTESRSHISFKAHGGLTPSGVRNLGIENADFSDIMNPKQQKTIERWVWTAAILAVASIGVLIYTLVIKGGDKGNVPDKVATKQPPQNPIPNNANPNPEPTSKLRRLATFQLVDTKIERAELESGGKIVSVPFSSMGAAEPNWKANLWNPMSKGEVWTQKVGDANVLFVKALDGPASAQVFSGVVTAVTKDAKYQIRIKYLSGENAKAHLAFRCNDKGEYRNDVRLLLAPTNGKLEEVTLNATAPMDGPLTLFFQANAVGEGTEIGLHSIELSILD